MQINIGGLELHVLLERLNVANRAASGQRLQISIGAWSYMFYWRGLTLQIGLQADKGCRYALGLAVACSIGEA